MAMKPEMHPNGRQEILIFIGLGTENINVYWSGDGGCVPATALDLQLDIKVDPKLKNNRSEQVLTKSSKLAPKSIQNGGSEASFWSVGGSILELFWKSGRVLAPKCVLESVVGGSWAF